MTWTPTGIPFSSFPSEGCLQKKQSTHKPEKKGKLETEHLMYLLLVFSLGGYLFIYFFNFYYYYYFFCRGGGGERGRNGER